MVQCEYNTQKVEIYWREIWEILKETLGYPRLALYTCGIGHRQTQGWDRYLMKTLASKKTIIRSWNKAEQPAKEQWEQ
jgi:hypothetical protein